jgi:filamentous hemagglutinin family protein
MIMKLRSSFSRVLLTTTALVAIGLCARARAESLPTGGHVVSGAVSIGTVQGNTLAIVQSTPSAIVNWNSFSIGQGNTVNIAQPSASSVMLDRVTGNATSTIAGSLNANGQVYLVNPNGIVITSTGAVQIGGGFVASTLNMTDAEFNGARQQFTGNGASAAVSNAGAITIGRGGYAALIGGTVANSGTISVPMGTVALGSGEAATLDLSGDGFLQVPFRPTPAGRPP